jgi:hypothetical protein
MKSKLVKCQQCGADESYHVKHLPLPNGHAGHITLTNWMNLCGDCIKTNSEAFYEAMEAAKKYAQGRQAIESTE